MSQAFRTMALRRAGQSLAGRLLQGQVPAFSVAGVRAGPVLSQQEDDQSRSAVCANSMPPIGECVGAAVYEIPSSSYGYSGHTECSHAGFATTTDLAPTSSGLPPTVDAIKNPSAAITYASLHPRFQYAMTCRVAGSVD